MSILWHKIQSFNLYRLMPFGKKLQNHISLFLCSPFAPCIIRGCVILFPYPIPLSFCRIFLPYLFALNYVCRFWTLTRNMKKMLPIIRNCGLVSVIYIQICCFVSLTIVSYFITFYISNYVPIFFFFWK